MDNIKTIEFDISGQICPSTLLTALREINNNMTGLKSGQLQLLIKSDNRDSTNTIPAAAGNMGLKASVKKVDASYAILITKG